MAPRSSTAAFDERPSSSGAGSGTLPSKRAVYDKRKSRDDLYLMTSTIDKHNIRNFHTPQRGRFASLDSHYHSHLGRPGAPGRMSTTDSFGSQGSSGLTPIGMALGSPTQDPSGSVWQPQALSGAMADFQSPQEEAVSKSKPRKWGLFGRSKSKKGRGNDISAQQVRLENMNSPSQRPSPNIIRSPSAAHPPKHKPIIIRSQTEPLDGEAQDPRRVYQPSFPAHPAYNPVRSGLMRARDDPRSGHAPPVPPKPLLNVEIPDITMERYSIMFGHVLKQPYKPHSQPQLREEPKPQLQSSPSRSSLLSRRQAALPKLQTVADERSAKNHIADLVNLPRPRRGTSPLPKNSPTFHLFPSTPKRSSLAPQSPRSRSNTSPAQLPSPLQAKFDQPVVRKEVPRSQTFPKPLHSNSSREVVGVSPIARKPQPSSRKNSSTNIPPTRKEMIWDSPVSMDEGTGGSFRDKVLPGIREPPPDTISPPASAGSSRANTPKKGSLSSIVSSEQINVVSSNEDETEKALREAVQASITRQISVSRDQRQLLGGLQNQRNRKRSDAKALPVTAIKIGKNERIAATKTATPTLVHPHQEGGQRALHRHKKSEHAVLEGA